MGALSLSLVFAATAFVGPWLATSPAGSAHWSALLLPFLTPLLALVVIPIFDLVMAPDARGFGPTESRSGSRIGGRFFDGVLVAGVIMQVCLVFWGSWFVSRDEVSIGSRVGAMVSVGLVSGAIGVTFAHELVHRQNRWLRWMGELILVTVCFGHFSVAHVYGHHRFVATPEDPATARKGQSLYGFFLQALPGVFACSYRIKPLRTMLLTFGSLMMAAVIGLSWGTSALVCFIAQSLIAILLAETVDYIEHYGLERKQLSDGRYEPVAARHSWDSDRWLTGKLLIHLQRHSDHHLHASKHFENLRLLPEARSLPTGYAGCLLLALVPPLWRRVMDERLHSGSQQRDESEAS